MANLSTVRNSIIPEFVHYNQTDTSWEPMSSNEQYIDQYCIAKCRWREVEDVSMDRIKILSQGSG